MVKICFFCEHCTQKSGFAYSEVTWESGTVECEKGHWKTYGDDYDLVDLGKELARAETCKDYSPARGIPADVLP